MTSSMPQSLVSPARPPSVTTAISGMDDPGRAEHAAQRPGLRELGAGVDEDDLAGGALTSAVASAGRIRTWWLSRPSAGRTSALGASALVSSRRWTIRRE